MDLALKDLDAAWLKAKKYGLLNQVQSLYKTCGQILAPKPNTRVSRGSQQYKYFDFETKRIKYIYANIPSHAFLRNQ